MTAQAIPTREDITAAWMLDPTFDVELALAKRTDALRAIVIEATCASCGDQCVVPGDEDPEDTLCDVCADDEANGYQDEPDFDEAIR